MAHYADAVKHLEHRYGVELGKLFRNLQISNETYRIRKEQLESQKQNDLALYLDWLQKELDQIDLAYSSQNPQTSATTSLISGVCSIASNLLGYLTSNCLKSKPAVAAQALSDDSAKLTRDDYPQTEEAAAIPTVSLDAFLIYGAASAAPNAAALKKGQ